MATESKIKAFIKGIHNRFNDEIIPTDALSNALGWITTSGQIELARGRALWGDVGSVGACDALHTGFKADGTPVYFKKAGTVIQTLVGSTWTNVITGLTALAPTTFCNYSSLAGAFVYIYSTDGIYKICTANPTDYTSLYDSAKNFKGTAFIDKGRAILWGRLDDRTGLYGSYIDAQNSTVYTSVSGEALADVASGTLAFKAGDAKRTCFAVVITDTSSGEIFRDNFNGVLVGSLGNAGTINYMTGAFTITGQSGAGTASYQWEMSNNKGVTDFTKSTPRTASQGFQFPQDIGGDPIQTVIPLDGVYYSMKSNTIYSLSLDTTDLAATNEVFRTNIGIPSRNAAAPTSKGILFLDTANGERPLMRMVMRNLTGDGFDTNPIFEHFDFSPYNYDDAVMFIYGEYALLACKESGATANNIVLMMSYVNSTVDILPYEVLSFTQSNGTLYTGDSLSQSAYATLNGFDDLGYVIENFAITKAESFEIDDLKKVKKLRCKGLISTGQSISVYGSFDEDAYQLLGTISGDATYVDIENPNTIGLNLIGRDVIGGSDSQVAYPYYCELKIKTPKFRKRKLKFVANGFGYASIDLLTDYDIWTFENKMPKRNRQKQNVSINTGVDTDLAEPNY